MILFCPDLIGKEEVKAVFVGHGDFVRPVLYIYEKISENSVDESWHGRLLIFPYTR